MINSSGGNIILASALRRPERSEEFDSLLWERWIHGGLDVEAEIRHEEVQKG